MRRSGCPDLRAQNVATSLLSVLLSIDSDIIRHPEGRTTADHAVRQRFTAFLPDFLLPFGRLISVRSLLLHKRRMRPSEIGAVAITRFFTRFSRQSTA
jgi:hypothetical protein